MKRKIIFFDIDGTLYSYKKGVPEDTARALTMLKEAGHIPVICTGRTKGMIFPEMLELNTEAYIAGAGTYLEVEGKVIYEKRLSEELAWSVIHSMTECDIMPIPESVEGIYYPLSKMDAGYNKIYRTYVEKIPHNIRDLDKWKEISVSKISGKINECSDLKRMHKLFDEQFNFVLHGDVLLELIPKGYSKAVGIKRLLQYYNEQMGMEISIEDTYAYGDSMNDYEMLQYVKYGVAMGNSSYELKRQSKYVTERYDEGGIFKSLKRFGLI